MFSFFEYIFPIQLVIKIVLIIILGLVTVIGAYIVPKGKLLVIVGGIVIIIIIWITDLEGVIHI